MESEKKTSGILNILRNQVLFVLIAFASGIISIISVFLPFASVSALGYTENLNLFKPMGEMGNGIIYILLVLVALTLLFFRKKLLSMIVSAVLFVLNMITYASISKELAELGFFSGMFKYKIGAVLLTISIILLLISTVILYLNEKKKI